MEQLSTMSDLAEQAAREAGEHIRSRFGKIKEIAYKTGVNDPVTDVDKTSEDIIVRRIKQVFPEHSILAEESGSSGETGDGFMWVIDPLDGTVNYAHQFPFFCVSIGLVFSGEILMGIVYDPLRDELFSAIKDLGAFMNGDRIFVSETDEVEKALISTGFAYEPGSKTANIEPFARMVGKARGVRRPGAAALDLCYVAAGRLDGFWEMNLSPWDTAAGVRIAREAGGKVTMMDRSPHDIFKSNVMASNGKIHDEMSHILIG